MHLLILSPHFFRGNPCLQVRCSFSPHTAQPSRRLRAGRRQQAAPHLRAATDTAPLHRSVSQQTLVKLKKRPEAYFCPLCPHWEGTAQLFSYMLTRRAPTGTGEEFMLFNVAAFMMSWKGFFYPLQPSDFRLLLKFLQNTHLNWAFFIFTKHVIYDDRSIMIQTSYRHIFSSENLSGKTEQRAFGPTHGTQEVFLEIIWWHPDFSELTTTGLMGNAAVFVHQSLVGFWTLF